MKAKKIDSSAPRKNPKSNDTVDYSVVHSVMSMWGYMDVVDEGVFELTKDALAEMLKGAFKLRDASPATWTAFLSHPLWSEAPKRRPLFDEQAEAPNFCFKVYFAKCNRATKRSSDYWRAFQMLELNGCSEQDVINEMTISDARIRKLGSQFAAHRRQHASKHSFKVDNAAQVQAEASSLPSGTSASVSDKRMSKIKTTAGVLTFPAGLNEFGQPRPGERLKLTVEILGGGGSNFEVKLIEAKTTKPYED